MGMRFSYLAVRPASAEQREALREELGKAPAQDGFVTYDYDDSVDFPDQLDDFGTRELSERFGEAIYVLYYDGPAGELCGTILYEHSRNGEVLRALAYSPNLWDSEDPLRDEELLWRRVEGKEEEWEAVALRLASRNGAAELQEMADCGYEGDMLARFRQDIHDVLASQCLKPGSLFPFRVQDDILAAVQRHYPLRDAG